MAITRPAVPAMDALLGQEMKVLDHGFLRVVDYMGDDSAVVQAARVSYGAGTKTINEDDGLIRYLMRNRHTTPFEMCELKLHVKLPVFVARQWIRHRTASVNEYSARYSVLDREFYVPDVDNVKTQSVSNKQGREDKLPDNVAEAYSTLLREESDNAFDSYGSFLSGGVARELARVGLPLGTYTQWYWKINLHNLMHFLSLRSDPHAQWEIRQYSDIILNVILPAWVPMTARAFADYRMGGTMLSAQEMSMLKDMLKAEWGDSLGDAIAFERPHGVSEREMQDFRNKFVGGTDA